MSVHEADYTTRIAQSFHKQNLMKTLGARLISVEPGRVMVELPIAEHISQQHGFVHAGAVATIADSAAGYAALSLMPAGAGVLSTEFKINLLSPAVGKRLIATGFVIKAGKTLVITQAEVEAFDHEGSRKLVALLTATMMVMKDNPNLSE